MSSRSARSAAATCLIGLVLSFGAGALAQARETPPLQWDPFAAPEPRRGATGRATARESSLEVWEPVLRATLTGERGALADLGGIVLQLGERANGYKLVAVRTFEADFEDPRGEIVTLALEGSSER